jgi:hypothetical protein
VTEEILEQLYAAEPAQFVSERKRLERELREAGLGDEADELAARTKPTAPVFAANRLARTDGKDVADLIASGERLTKAHESGEAAALRKEQTELAKRVAGLVRKAQLSDAMEQRLAVLLRTAATDLGSAELMRRGILSEELEPLAFGALAGLALAPPKARPKPESRPQPPKGDRAREEKRRARMRELEKQLAEAQRELDRAERSVAQLTKRLDDARGD